MAEPEKEPEKPVNVSESPAEIFPDVDKPHIEGLMSLLAYLGYEIPDIVDLDSTPYVKVEFSGGEEYFIMNDQEADEFAEEDIENLFDDVGMEGFNVNWPDLIENVGDFEMALDEDIDSYIEDIKEEISDDPQYATRLDQEIGEAGLATEEEYAAQMKDQRIRQYGSAIDWFVDEFGQEEFKSIAIVDTAALAKEVMDTDGRGHIIAGYDGDEIELGNGWYAYRMN